MLEEPQPSTSADSSPESAKPPERPSEPTMPESQISQTSSEPEKSAPSPLPTGTIAPTAAPSLDDADPAQNATTVVSGPVVGSGDAATPLPAPADAAPNDATAPIFNPVAQQRKSPKKKLTAMAAILVAGLLLAGGYVLAFYLPNTPSHVYSASLVNTGKAADTLLNYVEQQQQTQYKSVSLSGSLSIKGSGSSLNVNVSGSNDGQNATGTATVSVLGNTVTANARVIHVANSLYPDTYLQVTNSSPALLNEFGVGSLNGKWIEISHTYFENLAKNLQSSSGNTIPLTLQFKYPTHAQIDDAINKVQTVNKQYLFTTDKATAVLANEKFVGKTTLNGHAQDHYTVGYNAANLKHYFLAVGQALDSSKLNDWSKASYNGKSLSQALDLNSSSVNSGFKNADPNYRFDLWADPKTKLVSKLSFTDPNDKTSVVYVGQNYTGGSSYPFYIGFSDSKAGEASHGTLGLALDGTTHKLKVTVSGSDSSVNVSGNFTVTPSNNSVQVTPPAGAESFQKVLDSLGLGSLLPTGGSGTSSPANPGCSNPSLYLACSSSGGLTKNPSGGVNPGGPLVPACSPAPDEACPQ